MPDPLRVMLVAPASTGGIGAHVRDLAAGLVARGHTVTVAAPADTLATFDIGAVASATLVVPVGSGHPRAAARTTTGLRRAASQHDIVHAHGVRAGVQAGLAGARRLVVTWHNAPLGSRRRRSVHAALERLGARRADVVLGASADLVDRARRAGARRCALAPVAAPRPLPTPRGSATAAELDLRGLANGSLVVLTIARLHPQKRLDVLVDAVAGLEQVSVFVVGDGPRRADLERRIAAGRAPVTLLGARPEAARLLSQADVFALTSDWEARPLAVQEALLAGVPAVCTDVGGVRDLVGDAALLVPADDPRAVRAALLELASSPELRSRLAAAGRTRASTWPTVDNTVDTVENVYLDLYSRITP